MATQKITPYQISNPVKFSAYRAAAWTTAGAGGGIVVLDTESYDTSNNFSTSTGKFTAPVTGYYNFSGAVQYANPGAGSVLITGLAVNGTSETYRFQETDSSPTGNYSQSGAIDIFLTAGDTVALFNRGVSGAGGAGQSVTWMTGHLISVT